MILKPPQDISISLSLSLSCCKPYLKWNIGKVVNDEHQRSNANQVAGPREGQQAQGDDVVYEHHPKVLSLHVEELRKEQ